MGKKQQNLHRGTVDSLLTDTAIRQTPLQNGHLELVPAFLYSLYLTLYKTDSSLRRTLAPEVSDVTRVDCITYLHK